jgi:hypothetical protein
VPTAGVYGGVAGIVPNIGSRICFVFEVDSADARNYCAHEFGHCLKLRHPFDGKSGRQFASHNRDTVGYLVPAYLKTNTEPASAAGGSARNVMANDPTNLMGYWPDSPNSTALRYHQWKAARRR